MESTSHMHLLDRIEAALDAGQVDPNGFEEFAQDRLGAVYPSLAPIPKGTDWGRDADINVPGQAPIRVAITTARTLDGVRNNMLRSIKSLNDHEMPVGQMVLANLAVLPALRRASLVKSAAKRGVLIVGIYGDSRSSGVRWPDWDLLGTHPAETARSLMGAERPCGRQPAAGIPELSLGGRWSRHCGREVDGLGRRPPSRRLVG